MLKFWLIGCIGCVLGCQADRNTVYNSGPIDGVPLSETTEDASFHRALDDFNAFVGTEYQLKTIVKYESVDPKTGNTERDWYYAISESGTIYLIRYDKIIEIGEDNVPKLLNLPLPEQIDFFRYFRRSPDGAMYLIGSTTQSALYRNGTWYMLENAADAFFISDSRIGVIDIEGLMNPQELRAWIPPENFPLEIEVFKENALDVEGVRFRSKILPGVKTLIQASKGDQEVQFTLNGLALDDPQFFLKPLEGGGILSFVASNYGDQVAVAFSWDGSLFKAFPDSKEIVLLMGIGSVYKDHALLSAVDPHQKSMIMLMNLQTGKTAPWNHEWDPEWCASSGLPVFLKVHEGVLSIATVTSSRTLN